MFPRAARFHPTKISNTPGPNAYDPMEMVAHYKKGLLNQKDARFKEAENMYSNEGASTSAAALTTPAPGLRTQADLSNLRKEKAKYSAKLAKSEERIDELERQTRSLANEKSQAMAELRMSQQQIEKLQMQMSKTKSQAAKSDASQVRLTELQRVHEQSKVRHALEKEGWEAKYTLRCDEQVKVEGQCLMLRTKLESALKQREAMEQREATMQSRFLQEQIRRSHAESSKDAADEALRRQALQIRERQQERDALSLELEACQGVSEDRLAILQEQTQQRRALERVAISSHMEYNKLQQRLSDVVQDVRLTEMSNRRLLATLKEKEGEVRYLKGSIAILEEQVLTEREGWEEALLQVDAALSTRLSAAEVQEKEWEGRKSEQEESVSAAMQDSSELLRRLSEMAQQDERVRADELAGALEALHDQYLDGVKECASMQEVRQALEKTRQEMEQVEEAYEKGLLEVMRAHKGEEETRRELLQTRAENDGLTGKLRQFDKVAKKFLHAKMKEEAWLQERDELLTELERSNHYEAEYRTLRAQAQLLLSKSNQYEVQVEELSSLNTVLASHTNPSQKILYVDRIRRELDDKKGECQVLVVERDELQRECKDLQARLELFCSVQSRLEDQPRATFKRVARQSQREAVRSSKGSGAAGILSERSPNKSPQRSPRGKQQQHQPFLSRSAGARAASMPRFAAGRSWTGARYGDDEGDLTLEDLIVGV